jgi:ribosome-associated toxin RatA of RatAB toxin-antitoxin module
VPHIEKSALVGCKAALLFDLVDAVERYPEFLPWCGGARVRVIDESKAVATIDIDYAGVKRSFTTENDRVRHSSIGMRLVEGPFRRLDGRWEFVALGELGCRVNLTLDYDVAGGPLSALLSPVFDSIAATLIDRFVARAEALHATP